MAVDALKIDTGVDATHLAQALIGGGVKLVSAKFSGDTVQAGTFSGGLTGLKDVVDFDSGLVFSTGKATDITGTNTSGKTSTDTKGVEGDADFDKLSNGAGSHDAVFLEISFVPEGDRISLDFVFGSEEYNEYVYSGFNDSFACIVNGQNIAVTEDGSGIGIDTINAAGTFAPTYGKDKLDPNAGHDTTDGKIESANESLYIDNSKGSYATQMDGFTRTISIKGTVIPGQVNTLKIGIADSGDAVWDSWVLVRGASLSSSLTAEADTVSVAADGQITFDPLANDSDSAGDAFKLTGLMGKPAVPGQALSLAGGQVVTLNADGTLTVAGNGAATGSDSFTYTLTDEHGETATGVVKLTTTAAVNCLAAGTLIATPDGPRKIEDIRPGDLVATLDSGPQPVIWAGASTHRWPGAPDGLKPVRIRADALGPGRPARDLLVSPQHRMLMRDSTGAEVLCPARGLTGLPGVRVAEGRKRVTYCHLLLETHALLLAEGAATESFRPGPTALEALDAEARDSLHAALPALPAGVEDAQGPPARPLLSVGETRALVAALPRRRKPEPA